MLGTGYLSLTMWRIFQHVNESLANAMTLMHFPCKRLTMLVLLCALDIDVPSLYCCFPLHYAALRFEIYFVCYFCCSKLLNAISFLAVSMNITPIGVSIFLENSFYANSVLCNTISLISDIARRKSDWTIRHHHCKWFMCVSSSYKFNKFNIT